MESKRKKRKVHKAAEAQAQPQTIRVQGEHLIRRNGKLVEALLESEVWRDILLPLLQEQVAGVSGRYSNGRYHHGELTRLPLGSGDFLAGYQKALMDFNNGVQDFVLAKDRLLLERAKEEDSKKQPYVNPFLEDDYEDTQDA